MTFYLSRMISGQKDHEFFNDDYDRIKKCRSIWICLDDVDEDGSIEEFLLTKRSIFGKESKISCPDLIRGVIIRLGERNDFSRSKNKLIAMLEDLISKQAADEKIKRLVDAHGFVDTVEIRKEVSDMCDWSLAVEEKAIKRANLEMIARALAKRSPEEVKEILGVTDEQIEAAKGIKLYEGTVSNI